jgi:hypothetical protein
MYLCKKRCQMQGSAKRGGRLHIRKRAAINDTLNKRILVKAIEVSFAKGVGERKGESDSMNNED